MSGNLTQAWEIIKDAVTNFGIVKGTFVLFFWVAHFWIYRLYNGRLKDRQKQIDEIAKENREYRERFLTLLDRHFDLEKKPGQEQENGKDVQSHIKQEGGSTQQQLTPEREIPQLPSSQSKEAAPLKPPQGESDKP